MNPTGNQHLLVSPSGGEPFVVHDKFLRLYTSPHGFYSTAALTDAALGFLDNEGQEPQPFVSVSRLYRAALLLVGASGGHRQVPGKLQPALYRKQIAGTAAAGRNRT